MSTEKWLLVEEIFHDALKQTPPARKRFIEDATKGDRELKDEVLSLLEFDSDAEDVLRGVVAHDVSGWLQEQETSEIGNHVGPYLIVRELDSGGMGTVHLAVRSDDQYFQIVAIKMIRKGFATPQLIQRFRAERQILATLTHPHVGIILDGGVTEDGRPFMVMEYVEGESITQASKSRGLNVRERIALFRAACSAVHYAHQQLIIHRDIKPTNVLVTPEGVVKLIDFGIAKPLIPELLLDGHVPTELSFQPMTPDYASPEQLMNQELTKATDIYSLGVLLFELLTDVPPYSLRGLSPAKIEAVVLHGTRIKPSSVPHLDVRRRREISGDLDRIVLKALAVDVTCRYASAQQLEDDLVRYLEGRPLRARQPYLVYRLEKFIKRHRSSAITIAACFAIVVSAFLAYTIRARRSDRKVEQIRTLADSTILQLTDQLQQVPNSTEGQAAVFHRALEFLNSLSAHTGRDPRLNLELSSAYLRVGESEGSPAVPNLGNSGTAIISYRSALNAAMQAYASLKNDESTMAVIRAHQHLADQQVFLGNVREADDEFRQALDWAVPFYEKNRHDPARIRLLTTIYVGVGDNDLDKLIPNEALSAYAAAVRTFGEQPNGQEDHDCLLSDLHFHQAWVLNEMGYQAKALEQVEEGRKLVEDLTRRFPNTRKSNRQVMVMYSTLVLILTGRDLLNIGDSARSKLYAGKILSMAQQSAAEDGTNAQAGFDLSLAMTKMGDSYRLVSPKIAAKWYRKAILITKSWVPRYGSEAKHRIAIEDEALAEALNEPGEAAEKLDRLNEANLLRRQLSNSSPHARLHLMRSYCQLADVQLAMNNLPAASSEAALALPMMSQFDRNSASLIVLRDVGFCLETQGNLQRRLAADPRRPFQEQQADRLAARSFYEQSEGVWNEWDRRGATTPESAQERRRVQKETAALMSELRRRNVS